MTLKQCLMLIGLILAAITIMSLALMWLQHGVDEDRARYNACRDKGGSISWCAIGYK